ncbi:MAG: phage tail tape measure protein, partial [Oscillospiraceae bacterium]|nr:phage tail tape measure protein [Oscillospiraceae bacterium]
MLILAAVSDMVTDYMSAFPKSVSDYTGEALTAAEFSDKLAYAQANSNTNVQQQMDSVTAIIGMLANQGLKGSESGTALSAVMRDINNSMQDGQISINGTSIAIADQNGNYRDLIDIMADVEAVTGSMSETERSAALSSVFTADSIKGMNLVLNSGVDSVRKLEAGLSDCAGTADEMAKTLNDNLAGDVTYLESAMDAVKNSVYEGIEPALRSLVQSTTNEAAPALNSLVKNLFALASGSADAGKNIQSVMTNLVSWLTKQISAFSPQIVKSASTMMTALLKGIAENSTNFHIIALEIGEELLAGISDILPEIVSLGGNFIKSFGNSIRAKLPSLLQTGSEIVQELSVSIRGNLSGLFDGIKQIFYDGLQILNTLGDFINLEEMAEIGGNLLKTILSSFQQNLPEIQKISGLFLTKLKNSLLTHGGELLQIGSEIFSGITDGLQNLDYEKITDFIQKFFENFSEKIQKNGKKLQTVAKNLIAVLSGAISGASGMLLPVAGNILTIIANGFLPNLKIILPIAGNILSILISGIFSNLGEILTIAVVILETIGNAILANAGTLSATAVSILTMLCQFLLGNLAGLVNVALALISELCRNLLNGENLQLLLGCTLEIIRNLAGFLCENLGLILGAALEIVRFLADSLLSEDTMQLMLNIATQIVTMLAQFLIENLGFLIGATFQIIEFLCTELLTAENMEKLMALSWGILLAIVDGIAENIDELLLAVDSILNQFVDELIKKENLSRIFETGTKILKQLVEGLGKIGGSILGFSLMLYQEISEKL